MPLERTKHLLAFTITEILIIIAIIGIMASVTVTNFQAGQEDEALRLSALRVAEGVRSAQNYAQSGIHAKYPSARAFGVYVKKPGTIVVFADNTGPANKVGVWDAGGGQGGDQQIGDAISLAVGARKSISIDAQNGITVDEVSQNEVHIGFRTPTASALIDGKSEGGSIVITLKSSRNNHTKKVTINRITGRVDAEY